MYVTLGAISLSSSMPKYGNFFENRSLSQCQMINLYGWNAAMIAGFCLPASLTPFHLTVSSFGNMNQMKIAIPMLKPGLFWHKSVSSSITLCIVIQTHELQLHNISCARGKFYLYFQIPKLVIYGVYASQSVAQCRIRICLIYVSDEPFYQTCVCFRRKWYGLLLTEIFNLADGNNRMQFMHLASVRRAEKKIYPSLAPTARRFTPDFFPLCALYAWNKMHSERFLYRLMWLLSKTKGWQMHAAGRGLHMMDWKEGSASVAKPRMQNAWVWNLGWSICCGGAQREEGVGWVEEN